MIDDKFTIRITGVEEELPVSATLLVLKSLVKILRNINARMNDDNKPNLEWRFSNFTMNSPMFTEVYPKVSHGSDIGKQVVTAAVLGLYKIQQDDESIPAFFDINSLKLARGVVATFQSGLKDINVGSAYTESFSLSQRLSLNVVMATKDSYTDYGTFDGMLETLTKGRMERVIINDRIFGNIPCYFNDDMTERMRKLWAGRVSVSGMTTYTKSGLPKSIQVESINRLRPQSELPQWEKLKAMNLTVQDIFELNQRGTDGNQSRLLG